MKHWVIMLLTWAWMLWAEVYVYGPNTVTFSSEGGEETQATCERRRTRRMDEVALAGAVRKGSKLLLPTGAGDGAVGELTFTCLPDTIDPRRPK
jgi:hypothetical protein